MEGLRLAQALAIHHRYDEADVWARRVDAGNPPRPGAGQLGLGEQLLALHEPARAIPYLDAASRGDPQDAKSEYEFGQALLQAGRPREAVPHLRRGFEAGVELVVLGRYDQAALQLTEALQLDPDNATSLSHLAYAEAKLNRVDVARIHAQAALTRDPNDSLARQLLALLR